MQNPEDTLKLVRKDMAGWRRVHRRGPLPLELRRRAGMLAQFVGAQTVADALDLDLPLIERWAEVDCAPQDDAAKGRARHHFVDVGHQLASVLGSNGAGKTSGDWYVEVSKPCGTRIRVQGPINAALLEAVIRGAVVATH